MSIVYDINSITTEEYIQIVSTFWSIHSPEFNCQRCKKKYSESVRETRKACSTIKETPVITYNKINYFKCPSNWYNSGVSSLVDIFRHYKSGMLPFEGGLLEQPSKVIEIFSLIDSLNYEHQKDLEQEAKKWQTARSRSNSRSMNKKH